MVNIPPINMVKLGMVGKAMSCLPPPMTYMFWWDSNQSQMSKDGVISNNSDKLGYAPQE